MVQKTIKSVILISCLIALLISTAVASAREVKIGKVDTSKFPNISLTINSSNQNEKVDVGAVSLKENGRMIRNVSVKTMSSASEPMAVLLLIDASGSMAGKPLEDAKIAAAVFINQMDTKDRVAVVTFNSIPTVLADFTNDKVLLKDAISKVAATGETAVYDAVSLGLQLLSNSRLSQGNIVLLSDGADTASKATIDQVLGNVRSSRVPVYTIALESGDFDFTAISRISADSGGSFLKTPNTDSLALFYSQLAKELKNKLLLTYKSPAKKGEHVNLEVLLNNGGQVISDSVLIDMPKPTPALSAGQAEKALKAIKSKVDYLTLVGIPIIILLFALSAGLIAYALLHIFIPDKNTLKEQLKIYDRIHEMQTTGVVTDQDENDLKTKVLDFVGRIAAKRGFTDFVSIKLEQAGLPVKPREYIFFHFIFVNILGFIALLTTGSFLSMTFFVVLGVLFPLLAVGLLIKRRQEQFNNQLPDTLSMMSGSLKAGYGPLQAIDLVTRESIPPMSLEFKRVLNQTRLGIALDEAMENMAKRVGSETFYWAVMAINVQKEIGGNLAQILDILSDTLRQREAAKRQIKALTAEGRLSAIILFVMPFVQGFILFLINPSYMSILFTNILGWVMITITISLMIIGALWLRKIVTIEV